jgi:hypothetical protein
MSNFTNPYGQSPTTYNYQQIQQMFPQPQGSVYAINAPTEIGNVPIGSTGLSVAICFNEQLMYIKSFQNGNPVIMAYRVIPYTKEESTQTSTPTQNAPSLEERMTKLENLLTNLTNTNEGGKFNGLL